MKEKIRRTERLIVPLTAAELQSLCEAVSLSTCRKKSEFARKKLFDKPVTIFVRNQSMDECMAEMIILRQELNAIGNNFNQLVRRLYSIGKSEDIKKWSALNQITNELLVQKIEQIKIKITQLNDQWLQS